MSRKRLFPKKMRKISANMTEKHIEMAKLIGDGNCSKGIRLSLLRCARIGFTPARLCDYFREIRRCGTGEYVDRKISIRITISEEHRTLALEFAGSVCEGVRLALELYELSGDIDADLVKRLAIVRMGLYKQYDRINT